MSPLQYLNPILLLGLLLLIPVNHVYTQESTTLGIIVLFQGDQASIDETPTALNATIDPSIPILLYDTTPARADLPHRSWRHLVYTADNTVVYEQAHQDTTPFESALTRARDFFSDVDFFLILDGAWRIEALDELVAFCKQQLQQHPNPLEGPQWYALTVSNDTIRYKTPCLVRSEITSMPQNMRAYSLFAQTATPVPQPVQITTNGEYQPIPYMPSLQETTNTDETVDVKKEYRKHKQSPNYIFGLAQRMEAEDHIPQARELYIKRTKMGNPRDECTWYAYYKAAVLTEQLATNPENKVTWDDALDLYRKAYTLKATRAEPMIRVALHYASIGEYNVAYEYAIQTRDIPIPDNAFLPVETYLYTQVRQWLLSACALLVGDYHFGYDATKKALNVDPHNINLRRSLMQYQNLLQEKRGKR